MSATIKSIADEAGVSTATVSRVLNGSDLISEETRRRVAEVAQRLGYVPNTAARSLVLKQNHTFGALTSWSRAEYLEEIIGSLDESARGEGRLLMLSCHNETEDDLRYSLGSMKGRTNGLVLYLPHLDPACYSTLLPEDVPVVLINPKEDGSEHSQVSTSDCRGARLATQHLIEQGHEHIGLIVGALESRESLAHYKGYCQVLQEAGLPLVTDWILEGGADRWAGVEAVYELLKAKEHPTGIFAGGDRLAMGVVSALQREGVKVPEDVSVIGFNNLPAAEAFDVPLSTIDSRLQDLGARAISMLMRLEKEGSDRRCVEKLTPSLVVRESTCPCR